MLSILCNSRVKLWRNKKGGDTEKYKTFTVPVEKEVTKINKNGEEITEDICYILQTIDSARFTGSSFSNFVNNLSEGNHTVKCKYEHYDKKCETCGTKYKYCDCFIEYTDFKHDLIEYKCLCCNKNYQHKFDEKIKERFFNAYKFSNHENNKFNLLLQRWVYPYQYMDYWEKFNETEREDVWSHLNMEDITDADYAHEKKCLWIFWNKKIRIVSCFVCLKWYIIVSRCI